jgi:hypothetical protein
VFGIKRHEFKLKRIAFRVEMNCGQCVSKHGLDVLPSQTEDFTHP